MGVYTGFTTRLSHQALSLYLIVNILSNNLLSYNVLDLPFRFYFQDRITYFHKTKFQYLIFLISVFLEIVLRVFLQNREYKKLMLAS